MKNLDLNSYGVQEMNAVEMMETDGGIWQAIVAGIVIYLAISTIENPGAFMKGLKGERL